MNNEFKGLLDQYHDKYQSKLDAQQKHLDALDIKLQGTGSRSSTKSDSLAGLITKNFDQIKDVSTAKSIEVKAVGDMTLTASLTLCRSIDL